jgi:hypothetical protein
LMLLSFALPNVAEDVTQSNQTSWAMCLRSIIPPKCGSAKTQMKRERRY